MSLNGVALGPPPPAALPSASFSGSSRLVAGAAGPIRVVLGRRPPRRGLPAAGPADAPAPPPEPPPARPGDAGEAALWPGPEPDAGSEPDDAAAAAAGDGASRAPSAGRPPRAEPADPGPASEVRAA